MSRYDLKLSTGKVVVWDGVSGEDAAHNYVANHPGTCVVASRRHHEPEIVTLGDLRSLHTLDVSDRTYSDHECARCGRAIRKSHEHPEHHGYHPECAEASLAEVPA